ncbi:hypothetical protein EI94DRAFT_1655065 [Lactarius quietus]|nr:hypothetical protein EI94DRAFT_1655065 [Lactarius quietus]
MMSTKPSSEGPDLNESTSTPFDPPFDDADADAILRSSNQVDFHVYRTILSKSSSFFKSMFSLPQPDATSVSEKLPVIDLAENSKTIEVLLTSIYPIVSVDTEPLSLDDMINLLVAARKYDMAAASQGLNQKFAVSKVVQDKPVEAFYAAYSHELGEAARAAAKASLKHRMRLDDIGEKLQYTNGPALHRLWKFHRACSATAAEAVSDTHLIWITKSATESHKTWWGFASGGCKACQYGGPCSPKYTYTVGSAIPFEWVTNSPWHNFITRARDVLLEHPCAEAVAQDSVCGPSYSEKMCHPCQSSLHGLPVFTRLLGEEVENRVSMVDLNLPF